MNPPSDHFSDGDTSAIDTDICVVTHPLGAAGENATRTLLEILSTITTVSLVTANLPADSAIRKQHDVIELTTQGAGQSNVLIAAARFLRNQLRMCLTLTRREERIVLFFGATAYLVPILWARLLGRTVIVEPRGDVPLTLRLNWETRLPSPLPQLFAGSVRLLERIGFRLADRIVTYTPSMADQLGLNPDNPKVFPAGARFVDTDRFRPTTSFEERGCVVGYLGRLDEEKGIRTLAKVVEHLPPSIQFRFIGDGELAGWLRKRFNKEATKTNVTFTGWIDHEDVPGELNQLRLLVMPSQPTEGLPTTILEALACGTPVYATPVAGVPDVVIDGKTGIHMTDTNPETIANEIERLVEGRTLIEMSQKGRDLIESKYSFEAAVDRYRSLLVTSQ